jgi:hypothetical protein
MENRPDKKSAVFQQPASHYADTHDSFGEESLKVYGYWDLSIGAYNN